MLFLCNIIKYGREHTVNLKNLYFNEERIFNGFLPIPPLFDIVKPEYGIDILFYEPSRFSSFIKTYMSNIEIFLNQGVAVHNNHAYAANYYLIMLIYTKYGFGGL